MKSFIFSIFSLFIFSLSFAQKKTVSDITANDLKEHISYLASDALKGRKTGAAEDKLGAEYIKNIFLKFKLKPLCDNGFQYFDPVTDVEMGVGNNFSFDGFTGKAGEDFNPFSFSKNGTLTSGAVFVGYGFDIPADSIKWNDYKDVDVKGKWAVIFRGEPDPDNMSSPYIEYSQERYKVITAKEKGAAGVIFITGKSQEKEDKIVLLNFDKNVSDAGIPVLNINRILAEKLFKKANHAIDETEENINKNKKPLSFIIPCEVSATTNVVQVKVRTQNVVMLLEGSDLQLKDEYIVLGAHFDHLGMGGKNSGSRMPDTLAVHNGADDNASGVAAILEIAEKMASLKTTTKRSIIFVAFTGEEIGMLGSKYFVKNLPFEKTKIKAMFNFDMVGRMKKDKKNLSVSGTGTSVEWESILNKYTVNRLFETNFTTDGYGPSDHAAFYSADIPVLFFTTGAHEDYHTPFDDADKIDYDGEKAILDFAYDIVFDVANLTSQLTFREAGSKEQTKTGKRYKITLGIVPDVTGAVKDGLGVDGVRKDGPADKGGVKKGDIIIAMDGKKVSNVYDYMFCLSKLQRGKTVSVEVLRGENKEILLIVL